MALQEWNIAGNVDTAYITNIKTVHHNDLVLTCVQHRSIIYLNDVAKKLLFMVISMTTPGDLPNMKTTPIRPTGRADCWSFNLHPDNV